ncbi:MAG: hypothetical protein KDB05_29765, partial [Planctomycetales bacterium]|nr:hypothetical protein [Planctomycetales bacterium]
MFRASRSSSSVGLATILGVVVLVGSSRGELVVSPASVLLDRPESSHQLLVSVAQPNQLPIDVSRSVSYQIS